MAKTEKKNKAGRIFFILLKTLFIVLIIGVFAVTAINIYIVKSTENQIISLDIAKEKEFDCIIVLGAMVYSNRTPSTILKERLDKSIELYKAGVADKILMSGDNGQREYNEVIPMRQYAINNGIPAEDIFLDYAGFTTYESMYRARDVFMVKKAVVVTQTYHLYRTLFIGNELDIEVFGVAASDVEKKQLKRDIREVFARVKSFALVTINASPKYLGNPVPLDEPQDIIN